MNKQSNNQSGSRSERRAAEQARTFRYIRNAAIAVALLVVILLVLPRLGGRSDRSAANVVDSSAVITLPPEGVDTFVFESTPEPTALSAGSGASGLDTLENRPTPTPTLMPTPSPTATPTPEPTPTPTPKPKATATAKPKKVKAGDLLDNAKFKYLPVINDVDTDNKWIAITVDDCFQVKNLQKIIKCAKKYKAKLTIFPIGQNLSLSGMKSTIKGAVKLGFEIENHTWSHARVFRMSEKKMAQEIWKQDQAVNKLLGVTYQEHFFRCMGGDGELDQRTHNYLKQLGYKAIAHWSYSGSDATLKQSQQHLHKGAVYLFHTTDRDTKILLKFIPWVAKKGYKMVTLNKLCGYSANKTSKLKKNQKMPTPKKYTRDYRTIHRGEYSWMVVQLQKKLYKKGYLKLDGGKATGYYGDQTAKAVMAFQKKAGLDATGEADAETQKAILAL